MDTQTQNNVAQDFEVVDEGVEVQLSEDLRSSLAYERELRTQEHQAKIDAAKERAASVEHLDKLKKLGSLVAREVRTRKHARQDAFESRKQSKAAELAESRAQSDDNHEQVPDTLQALVQTEIAEKGGQPEPKTQRQNNAVAGSDMQTSTAHIFFERWVLVAGVLFCELAFKFATSPAQLMPQLVFIALFSFVIGEVLELLTSFVRPKSANLLTKFVILAALGLIFSTEYLVWVKFKVFYDLRTIVLGASDVASGFGGEVYNAIFSANGVSHILLFFAPAILYAIKGRGELAHKEHEKPERWRLGVLAQALGGYVLALVLIVASQGFWASFTQHYSFQTSIPNFGVLVSLRRDVCDIMNHGGRGFGAVEHDVLRSEQTNLVDTSNLIPELMGEDALSGGILELATPAIPEPVTLDIDFDALAQSAPNERLAETDAYVASLTPSLTNAMTGAFEGYNLIFISAEAFSAEAIREDVTPTLWRMATRGINFTDYYQFDTAGTTGGECANLFGLLATEGGNSVKITADHNNWMTLGNMLDRKAYEGWAFHNNTYTYYSRDKTHVNLGYSNGYMGYGNGMEAWVTWQWPQSDLEMIQGTYENLYGSLGDAEHPFNVYYMSVSGHSDYGPGQNAMAIKNWDVVADLDYSDRVRGYLGANVELDRAMEWLIGQLEEDGIADRTVIVIAADHFPYGLDDDAPLGQMPYLSELYGYNVTDYFVRDHNRLIIWSGALEETEPIVVDEPTSSVDILPTLLNLFACEWDSRLLPGRDVFSGAPALVFDLNYNWKTELGTYYAGSGEFVPNEGVEIPEGYVEAVSQIVANKIAYCREVLELDYYAHVFG